MYNILTNNNKLDLIKDKDRIINIDYLCTDGHHAYDVISNHILFKDYINNHIVSKKETCLVESYNSSMRDRLARLKRKSKAYSKSQYMLEISLNLWINMKDIFKNIVKYCLYSGESVDTNNY